MDNEKVNLYLMSHSKYFPEERMPYLREFLTQLDENGANALYTMEFQEPTTLLLLSIFLGGVGVDRFMLGDVGMGILKLLTGGLCGILWIVDICTISKKVKESNFNKLMAVYFPEYRSQS